MPIHLPPISRRRFLAGTIAAGAGLLLPRGFAAEPPVDKDYWALFSDLHISGDPAKVARDTNMTDNFKSVVQEVLALPQRPAAVMISGDCAFNSGEQEDYSALKGLLRPLREHRLPIHITLGNHDQREHWQALLQDEPKKVPSELSSHQVALIKTKRVNWFILDSLEKTLSTPGLLGEEQLAWLAKSLDANAHKPALVVVHHNLKLNQFSDDGPGMALKDTDKLLEVLRPRRQVKAYIFGHTHFWRVNQDVSGIHLVNLPPTAYVFAAGKPSGWVRAHLREDGMKLELRCLNHSHEAHGQVVDLKWRSNSA